MADEEKIRLSKLMSERGLCSRREADDLISRAQVLVDGVLCDQLGTKVTRKVEVSILADGQKKLDDKVTIILNKPTGYVSTPTDDDRYPVAIQLLEQENQITADKKRWNKRYLMGLAPTGRLDIDSQGLMIFTQDGTLAKKIIGENSEVEKEYLVRVDREVTPEIIDKLEFGIELDGKPLKRARVYVIPDGRLCFILKEGKQRQIRRMCEVVDLQVSGLKRVRVGRIQLGDLPVGQWRFLSADEQV